jgi:hypothetical protein
MGAGQVRSDLQGQRRQENAAKGVVHKNNFRSRGKTYSSALIDMAEGRALDKDERAAVRAAARMPSASTKRKAQQLSDFGAAYKEQHARTHSDGGGRRQRTSATAPATHTMTALGSELDGMVKIRSASMNQAKIQDELRVRKVRFTVHGKVDVEETDGSVKLRQAAHLKNVLEESCDLGGNLKGHFKWEMSKELQDAHDSAAATTKAATTIATARTLATQHGAAVGDNKAEMLASIAARILHPARVAAGLLQCINGQVFFAAY